MSLSATFMALWKKRSNEKGLASIKPHGAKPLLLLIAREEILILCRFIGMVLFAC